MKCRMPRKKTAAITPTTAELTLSGIMSSSYGYVMIDGTKYSSAQTLEMDIGTEVTVFCSSQLPSGKASCVIKKGGSTVAKGSSSAAATYTLVLAGATEIKFTRAGSGTSSYYWSAGITMN